MQVVLLGGQLARRSASTWRPRTRLCLLKGCEERFHPRQACQCYCSAECRKEARRWSRWKAHERYRETAAGQEKRNGQSRRYRERVKSRNSPEPETVNEAARVITTEQAPKTIWFNRTRTVQMIDANRGVKNGLLRPLYDSNSGHFMVQVTLWQSPNPSRRPDGLGATRVLASGKTYTPWALSMYFAYRQSTAEALLR